MDLNEPVLRAAAKVPRVKDDGVLERNDHTLLADEEAVEYTRAVTIGDLLLQRLTLEWALIPNIHLQPGWRCLEIR